jgi:hypothetical protein
MGIFFDITIWSQIHGNIVNSVNFCSILTDFGHIFTDYWHILVEY